MTKMDVVLVRPWARQYVPPGTIAQDPLGIGYLAAVLRRDGYKVGVVDGLLFGFDNEQLIETIATFQPKLVGISLHSFADYRPALAITEGLKKLHEAPYCVWGGEHATFHAHRILEQHPVVDAVVQGEGELTMLDMVGQFQDGHRPVVAGAVTRQADGTICDGGFRPSIEDLDVLPDAEKDVVEMALVLGKPVALSVLTGRGCTSSCKFCTANTYFRLGGGTVWRRRSPERVVEEIERLVRSYMDHSNIHPVIQFQDVIFLGTSPKARAWVDTFLDKLEQKQLRFPFYFMARADALLANEDVMPRLVKAGLRSVEMGIESGVDRLLELYNKRNSAKANEDAIELLRRHGVAYDASGFIMFDPRMTAAELLINASALSRFGPATWDFFMTRLQLYPGTEVRAQMIADGLFPSDADIADTSGYAFLDPVVDAVSRHTFLYDPVLRKLDRLLRQAKALCAGAHRDGRPAGTLERAVELTQEVYRNHFAVMVSEAEVGRLEASFPVILGRFLEQVWNAVGILGAMLDSGDPEAVDLSPLARVQNVLQLSIMAPADSG